MNERADLVVFSHLRWDFVYQRPQHLLSRLARQRRVFFIEEPLQQEGIPSWQRATPEPNILVCKPQTPVSRGGFNSEQMPALRCLMKQLLAQEEVISYVAWFYTPMAVPLVEELTPRAIVYDCMDELSLFLHAPPELLENEKELFRRADLVFTGGPSLYKAKKDRHPSVHCFPSSVDAKHFSKAAQGCPEGADQAGLSQPRLGYFGVIDERLDLGLLDTLAKTHPEWQIVMVGPVVKIDPAMLPRHPNLHYLGQKPYAELPAYLVGWDVALMPFARNDATRFISPTKILEYMAAEKPIVSTPITDVAEPYGDIVYLGDTATAFVQACERAMYASPAERAERSARMHAVLARTSWDHTAEAMSALIDTVVAKKSKPLAISAAAPQKPADRLSTQGRHRLPARSGTPPVLIVGAGPTGLSAAYHLGEEALLLEKNDTVGGWCRSLVENGFTFDFAGHIMFSNEPYVHEMYKMLLGDNVHWQDREAWIYSKNVYTRYPFQGALYGLPPQVIKECIVGAIEARFGPLKSTGNASLTQAPVVRFNGSVNGHSHANGSTNGHTHGHSHGLSNGAVCKPGAVNDCCGDGIAESTTPLVPNSGEPRNFEEFIYKVWGAGIAKHFAIPYNRKIWAVPLTEMETSWLGGRVPLPNLEEMIEGALQPVPKPMGPNARFGYPLKGGFQALMNGFLPHLQDRFRLNTAVSAVSPTRRTVTLGDGTELPYETLISTMPLPVLIRQMGQEVPDEVRKAAANLRHTSVRCVHLGIGRENLTEKHWIYYPEDTVFHRIFVQGNASPHCNPPGGFGLTCEITYSPSKPLPCEGDALIQRCITDCHKVGFFKPEDPVWAACQVDLPYAYVVYDHARPKNVKLIREWLAAQDILLAGRYSEWEYYNSDHAFVAGKKAAEQVRQRRQAAVVV
jgi:UDP-galactopyranose mutase